MKTMIVIKSHYNGTLAMYDKSNIVSLNQCVENETASIKLVTGEYYNFEEVSSIEEEDIYAEGELEAIIQQRNNEMANNPILQERYELEKALMYDADVRMNNTLRQMVNNNNQQPQQFNYPPFGYRW